MWYIITGIVSFLVGFIIAARTKKNITVGVNNSITQTINIDDE